jgi:hypothetical protein
MAIPNDRRDSNSDCLFFGANCCLFSWTKRCRLGWVGASVVQAASASLAKRIKLRQSRRRRFVIAQRDRCACRRAAKNDGHNGKALVEQPYAALLSLARTAVSCSPTDSSVWLTLFWLDGGKNDLTPAQGYLR